MVDGDVKLKITPEIDTSDITKDMDKIAKASGEAVAKSMNDLTNTVSHAMKMAQEDIAQLNSSDSISDIFKRAADAVRIFNERTKEVRGLQSLDPDVAKLYRLEMSLNRTAKSILRLQGDWEKLVDTATAKTALDSAYGGLEEAKKRVEELRVEINKLSVETSMVSNKPAALASLTPQYENIVKLTEQLKRLYAERDELEKRPDKGSETWIKHMELLNELIPMVTQELTNMSNAFYAAGKEYGLGKTKEDIVTTLNKMQELTKLTEEFRAALVAIHQVNNDEILSKSTIESLANASVKFDNIIKNMSKLSGTTLAQTTKEIANNAKQAGDNYGHLRAQIRAGERLLAQFYTLSMDVVHSARMIASVYSRIWSILKSVGSVFTKLRDHIKLTAKSHAVSWKEMLRTVVKYAFGIRTLFALFRRLRRYIREAFEEMAKQIPEVNKVMSELKSSLGMLKGSLATAFEPIVSAIAPLLNLLIEKLSQVMTYIGMFFAALTGRGYVYKATKSMQSFAKETKKANKQLQKFDELNNITTNKNKKDDEPPIAIFKKVPVLDWIKDLADKIKNIINQIIGPIKKAWALVGDYVKWAWLRAFTAVKKFLLDVGKDFLRAWEKWGTPIFIRIFQIIGDIGEIIANIAEALDEAWNANDNGYKIWNAILEIIYKIVSGIRLITKGIRDWTSTLDLTPAMTAFREWLESLVPVVEAVMNILYDFWNDALKPILTWAFDGENSGIARLFNIFRDFNKKVQWQKLRANLDKIWKAVGRFGKTIGEGLLQFLENLSNRIANWVNSKDFEDLCDKIVEFLDNIKPEDIADDLDQVLRIVKNLAKAIWDAIKFIIDHKDQILDALEWASKHIKGILIAFASFKLSVDLVRFFADIWRFYSFFKDGAMIAAATKGGEAAATAFAKPILGQATAVGGTLATNLAAGFMSAWAGLEFGRWIGEHMYPDDKELYEKYDGLIGKVKLLSDTCIAAKDGIDLLKDKYDDWKDGGDRVAIMNQNLSREIRDGAIPSEAELAKQFEDTGARAGVVRDQIEDLTQKVFDANPELQNLATNVENAGIAMDGLDAITQVAYGLDYFNDSGNNAADTSQYLAEKFGFVDEQAQFFFEELEAGNQTYVDAANAYSAYVDSIGGNTDRLVTSIDKSINDGLPTYEEMMGQGRQIGDGVTEGFKMGISALDVVTKPTFTGVVDMIRDVFKVHSPSEVTKDIGVNVVLGLIEGWKQTIPQLLTIISSFGTTFTNAFINIKNSVLNVFTSMTSSITNILRSLLNSISSALSSIVSGVSNTISRLKASVNNVTSGIGSRLNINIPRLAQGAVIPPNKEFLAVLGDQKSGTNVESPLSTMVEAFNQAGGNRSQQEISLLQEQNQLLRQLIEKEWSISASQMFSAMQRQAVVFTKQSGKPAF